MQVLILISFKKLFSACCGKISQAAKRDDFLDYKKLPLNSHLKNY
jgi:hypothetical protein